MPGSDTCHTSLADIPVVRLGFLGSVHELWDDWMMILQSKEEFMDTC